MTPTPSNSKTKRLMTAAAVLLILAVLVWQFRPRPESHLSVTPSGQIEFSRSEIQHFTSNLATTLQQARVIPQVSEGEVECFQFTEIQPDSFFARLGLKANDCVQSVDGQPLTSVMAATNVFQNLKDASSFKLSLLRDGQIQELIIVLK